MRERRCQRRRGQAGQALVETAIIMPVMLLAAMGALQLMFIQHARVLTEYGAFNACRAGIVHNGDRQVMKNALLVSTLPIFGRTDTVGQLLLTYGEARLWALATGGVDAGVEALSDALRGLTGIPINLEALAPDVSLVNITVINPIANDATFTNGHGESVDELDFDEVLDPQHVDRNTLVIEARTLVPLRIPFINKIIFELWLAHQLLFVQPEFAADVVSQAAFKNQIKMGQQLRELRDLLNEQDWAAAGGHGTLEQRTRQMLEMEFIRMLADQDVYVIPVYSSAAMPMQSNLFRDKLRPPLFDLNLGLGGLP